MYNSKRAVDGAETFPLSKNEKSRLKRKKSRLRAGFFRRYREILELEIDEGGDFGAHELYYKLDHYKEDK